jgi:purine-binding chemotaxis protein CheW
LNPAPAGIEESVGREYAQQILVFIMDGRFYGVPIKLVAEIQPWRPLNRMPHMPKYVDGLLDLRGQVVPVVNLRKRLGLAPREDPKGSIILVIEHRETRTGLLVDAIEGVVRDNSSRFHAASRMLVGKAGEWVTGFLVTGERLVTLFDPVRLASPVQQHGAGSTAHELDLESKLDEGLRQLISMAPDKQIGGQGRIIPQIEATLSHTEEEMAKVLDRVEAMLANSDQLFLGLARLKQEAAMGRLKGEEPRIAELEKVSQRIQDEVFQTIQLCQFQDIARQKLERVLRHIQGMQGLVGKHFKDLPKYR